MLTFAVYTQAFLVTVLYCVIALPLLLPALLFCGLNAERMRSVVRFFILWYGKVVIGCGWYPYVKVRYENPSGFAADGGIYIWNHRSSSDPFLVAAVAKRHPPAQVVNRWPMRLPFFGLFARLGGYLDITAVDYSTALEWTRSMIAANVPVMVFPEGTRSGGRKMNQFHGIFFRIAKELQCKLVPVAVSGNERCPDRCFRMSRGKIRICQLPPIEPETVRGLSAFQLKNRVRQILMEQTRKMDETSDL